MKYAFVLRGSLVLSLLALSCFCGLCYADYAGGLRAGFLAMQDFGIDSSFNDNGNFFRSYFDKNFSPISFSIPPNGVLYLYVIHDQPEYYNVNYLLDGSWLYAETNITYNDLNGESRSCQIVDHWNKGGLKTPATSGFGSTYDSHEAVRLYNTSETTVSITVSTSMRVDCSLQRNDDVFNGSLVNFLYFSNQIIGDLYNSIDDVPESKDPNKPNGSDPENPDPENPDPENPDPENPDPENPGTTDNPVLDVLNHIDSDFHTNNDMISGIQNGLANWSSAWDTSQNEAQQIRVDIKNSVADFKIDVGNGFTLLADKLETGNGYSATLVNSLGEVVSCVSTTSDKLSDLVTQSELIATDTSNIASDTSDIAQFTKHIDNLLTGTGLSIYGINNAIRNSLVSFRSTTQSQLQSVNDGLTTIHDDMVSVRELTSDELELVQSLDLSVKAGNTTLSEAKQILSDNGIYLEEILGEVGEVVGYYPVAIEKADLTNQKLDESIQKQDTTNEKIDDSNEKLDDIKSESQSINTNIQNNTSILNQIDNSIQNLGDKIEAPDLSWFQEGSGNSSVGSGSVSGSSLDFSDDYTSTVDYPSEVEELSNRSKVFEYTSEFNSVLSKLKNGSDSSEIVLFQLPETMGGHKIIIPSYAGFGILDNGDGSSTFIRKVLNLLGAIIGLLLCLELIEWAYKMVSK